MTFSIAYSGSMRIAIISDIHGNREALDTALEDITHRGVDSVVCLGDIVGYGPDPGYCIERVRDETSNVVLGNHDEAVFWPQKSMDFNHVARAAVQWTIRNLNEDQTTYLKNLPRSLSMQDILFVHSAPGDAGRWPYIFSNFEARMYFSKFKERLAFVGHSHVPGIFAEEPSVADFNGHDRFIINVGSIGQPRDRDKRLSYGILDTVAATYENIRLDYDVQTTASKILENGLPASLAERLFVGR